MKLSQSQIQNIENYLDNKKLEQVDLRYEVQDHMIVGIEQSLAEGISYKDAFNQQKEKWNPELESYSSFWLGYAYVGPKLMMKKCIAIIKKIYFKSILSSLITTGLLLVFFSFIPKSFFVSAIDVFIGVVFSCLFLLSVVWFFSIKTSNIKTTYQYFYKIQSLNIGIFIFMFMDMAFNEKQYVTPDMAFLKLLFPIYMLVSYHHLFKFYQKHNRVIKRLA
ncbi:hypothetical protein [uncultured Maribacter sp.]|uniref:hypothetical protein n=1 Tax=uncultured Maribacter sp. TaxID=431308 RepID=UPI00260E0B99|nr:hypothetical protein [uncultured Maribacter sp.]